MQIYDNSNSVLLRDGFIQVRGVKNSTNPNDQLIYEVINKKDAVVCLVLSNDLKTIYTTKQFRPCNNNAEIGLVAGILDKVDKDHREIIIEEIEEEIRINRNDIEKLVYVGGGFSSSGMTTEFVHRYFAVLSKDAKIDETLNKASDTDLIEKGYMPFNYDTYTKMTSNTSQLLMQEVHDILFGTSLKPKIAVYGGCFSPFTIQHMYVVIRIIEAFGIDKVIIVPSSKYDSKKKVSYETRKVIIEATISDYENSYPNLKGKIVVSDIEKTAINATSYKTMSKIRDEYGYNYKYYSVFGSDNLQALAEDSWVDRVELLESFNVISIERVGYEMSKIYLKDTCQFLIGYQNKIYGIPPVNDNYISSTRVRNRIANNLSIFGMVTPSAEKVIRENINEFGRVYEMPFFKRPMLGAPLPE